MCPHIRKYGSKNPANIQLAQETRVSHSSLVKIIATSKEKTSMAKIF